MAKWLALGLIVLPWFLLSSADVVGWVRLAALAGIACLAGAVFPADRRMPGTAGKTLLGALVVVMASGITGGILNGAPLLEEVLLCLQGFTGVLGMLVMARLLTCGAWGERPVRLALWLTGVLLLCSLAFYPLRIERHLPMGDSTRFFEPLRLVMIFPGRIAMQWMGQIGWSHANHAGLVFGLALVLLIDSLAAKPVGRPWYLWGMVAALGTAMFLAGSRGGWLMVICALPFALFRRKGAVLLKIATLGAVSLLIGMTMLKLKTAAMQRETQKTSPAGQTGQAAGITPPPDAHTTGLVDRGSAGRGHAYRVMWQDSVGSRTFGQGWRVAGKPMAHLPYEHSIFLATLRSGGFVALAAHGVILAIAAIAALARYRDGLRWPLLLLIMMIAAGLFDRSTVFLVTGGYEFPLHWLAVFAPLVMPRIRNT